MRPKRRTLRFVVASSLLVIVSLLMLSWLGILRSSAAAPSVSRHVKNRAQRTAILRERALEGPIAATPGLLVREPMPFEDARRLLGVLRPRRTASHYHPQAYYKLKPGLDRHVRFPPHPRNHFYVRSNNLGLREDKDLEHDTPDLRVIITGDSQTDGVCANINSFPNRLEAKLAAARPGQSIDVVNAGRSGYTFYNYLGVLEWLQSYRPQVFVMTVYGGNDFVETLTYWHYFHRTLPPECQLCADTMDEMDVRYTPNNTFLQCLRQIHTLLHHPKEKERALQAACDVTAEIQRVCDREGIQFLCVYLPTVVEVRREQFAEFIEPEREKLGLDNDDLALTTELADRWLAFAQSQGTACLDLRPVLLESELDAYWPFDLHLDLEGNDLVAEALLGWVEEHVMDEPRPRITKD